MKAPSNSHEIPLKRLGGVPFTDLLGDSHHCPEFQEDPDTTTAATARAFQTHLGLLTAPGGQHRDGDSVSCDSTMVLICSQGS